MTFEEMIAIEPELKHLADSAIRARQQNATWPDYWATHHQQLTRLVGFGAQQPELRHDYCWRDAYGHLCGQWVRAELADQAKLPWNDRPLSTAQGTLFEQETVGPY